MDSGNTSGSMQSSSGGDEEYDSRAAESISDLLSNNPQNDVVHHPHQHHHQSSMFDPFSNFFDPVSSSSRPDLNPNPLLNLDMVWPKPVRSDPNSSDFVSLIPSSSQSNFNNNIQLGQRQLIAGGASTFPAIQISPEIQTRSQIHPPHLGPSTSSSSTGRNDAVNIAPNGAPARNPKKRSRASRRAPTTVLTTDTTNFRAMVQEFTGIPAPPFTSSPFPRTRVDLFGSGSGIRSSPLDSLHHSLPTTGSTSYTLLRPFAMNINQQTTPPFVNSTSTLSSPPPTMTSSNASINAQSSSLLNIQNNPVLSLHSLLQSAPMKFPKIGSTSAILEQDQFGLSHGHHVNVNASVNVNVNPSPPPSQLGGHQNLPTTTTMTTTANWGASTDHGMGSNDNNNGNSGNNNSNVDEGLFLRSINGGYTANTTTATATTASNGHKRNYSASSSTDFHGSKTEINVAARSEGMVESWICSSD